MSNAAKFIAGNWKMNKGPAATREFFQRFLSAYTPRADRSVIFFPPSVSLPAAVESLRPSADVKLGVQNIHWEDEGAFTGEIGAVHAREAGAQYALIGHSERRHLFGETDDEVRRKVTAAIRNHLVPLVCVGELLDERHANRVEEVILRQLSAALDGIANDYEGPVLVAYEPVWAIGTGVTATPADASAAHAILRKLLNERLGQRSVPILYGGSVKPENAGQLLSAEGVDGLLVGGASLDAAGFSRIAAA